MISSTNYDKEKEILEAAKAGFREHLPIIDATTDNLELWLEFTDIDIFKVMALETTKPDIWIIKKKDLTDLVTTVKSKKAELESLKIELQTKTALQEPTLFNLELTTEKLDKIRYLETIMNIIDEHQLKSFFTGTIKINEQAEYLIVELSVNNFGNKEKNYLKYFFDCFDLNSTNIKKFGFEEILNSDAEFKKEFESLEKTIIGFDKTIVTMIQQIQGNLIGLRMKETANKVERINCATSILKELKSNLENLYFRKNKKLVENGNLITREEPKAIAALMLSKILTTKEMLDADIQELIKEILTGGSLEEANSL